MNVVIIEDEKPAAEKLQRALQGCNDGINVLAVIGSVGDAIQWFRIHPDPDLVFMDIELSDGSSFGLFDSVRLGCPIIFTTAFDEYWQEAFEHNSIDYLLKPIRQEKLSAALNKYELLKRHFANSFHQLLNWRRQDNLDGYKKRFLVKRGSDYISIKMDDVAYCYATHKLVCLVDNKGQKYILDQSLADIEKQLDPVLFYRVNRKYLVQQNAIKRIKAFPKSKLLLELEPSTTEEIIISQENVLAFKEWMGR